MRVNQIDATHFGITTKTPIKKILSIPGCYDEIREGNFKDYSFEIHDLFIDGKKDSTMIFLRKSGSWIKSKLKWIVGGKKNVDWYYASDKYKKATAKDALNI